MNSIDDSIGGRIKQARLEQGLSQVELAHAAKVSQPTVANWENDSHVPRQAALDKLSGILRTSPNWIRVGNSEKTNSGHTSADYLARPIQHVPISAWPTMINIENGVVAPSTPRDYVALSVNAHEPFALIANDPKMAAHFPIGAAIIFAPFSGELEDGKCYLFARDDEIILRRWQSAPDRLEALPNQSAVDADFLETRPRPLAKAIMSLRRH